MNLVSEVGLPPPGTVGLYAVQLTEKTVKFGKSSNIPDRLVAHHRSVKHLGLGFNAVWLECLNPGPVEKELFARLTRSGFHRIPGCEVFEIGWQPALRMLEAAVKQGARGTTA